MERGNNSTFLTSKQPPCPPTHHPPLAHRMAAEEDDFQAIAKIAPEARTNIESYTAFMNARTAMSIETHNNKRDATRSEQHAKEEKEKQDKIQRKAEVSKGVISFEPKPLVCRWDSKNIH